MKQLSLLLALAIVLTTTSCMSVKPQAKQEAEEKTTVESIAILPITTGTEASAKSYIDTKRLEKGSQVLSSLLNYRFAENAKITFIPEEQIEALKFSYTSAFVNQNQAIGKKLKSDAIMTWNINRYIDRDGSDYSVDQPASVAFEYRLMHIGTGKTLCAGVFDETQKSFADNLLSFKKVFQRGMKWISAKDLMREGIDSKLETCQYFNDSSNK